MLTAEDVRYHWACNLLTRTLEAERLYVKYQALHHQIMKGMNHDDGTETWFSNTRETGTDPIQGRVDYAN